MSQFQDRLDSSILAIERGEIVSTEVAAFDDDAAIQVFWKVPEGLRQEAIDWLRANALTYTDFDIKFRHFDGLYRTIRFILDMKNGGVVQVLAKGYYTELNWEAARIIQDTQRPAGTLHSESGDRPSTDYGATKERLVTFEFPYIEDSNVDALVAAAPSTRTDAADPSGTWYLIDATSEKREDGTHSIRAMYANTSAFSIVGRDGWGLPGASLSYNYFGVPKQLAQTICDLYVGTADRVRPSYNGNGTVDITVWKRAGTAISSGPIESENSCMLAESTEYYWGASELPNLPAASSGVTYSLQGVRFEQDGTYSYQVVTRTVVPYLGSPIIIEANAAYVSTETQSLGVSSVADVAAEEGHIISQDVRKRPDCTFDVTEVDREIKNQDGSGAERAALFDTIIETNTSTEEINTTFTVAQGVIKTVRSQPTPEGKFSTTSEERTSKPETAIEGIVEASERQTLTETRLVNQAGLPEAPSAQAGHIKSRSAEINQDGTFNTVERDLQINDQEGSGGTIAELSESEIVTHTSSDEVDPAIYSPAQGVIVNVRSDPTEEGKFRTTVETVTSTEKTVRDNERSQEAALSVTDVTSKVNVRVPDTIGLVNTGEIHRLEKRINADGTFNTELEVVSSVEETVRNDIVAEKTIFGETKILEKVNTEDADEAGTQVQGVLVQTRRSINQDGTANTVKTTTTSTEVTDPDGVVTGINKAETVKTTRVSNDRAYTPPTQQDGFTKSLQVEPLPDGTYNTVLVEREVTDQAGNGAVASVLQTVATETHTANTAEEAAIGSGQGIIVRVSNEPTPEGRFRTTKETITAVEAIETNQVVQDSHLQSVTEESKKNAAAVPAVNGSIGTIETVEASVNQDGTFNYSKRSVESIPDTDAYIESANANEVATKTVNKNSRTEPTAIAQIDGRIYTKTQRRNADGTWDAETSEFVPTKREKSGTYYTRKNKIEWWWGKNYTDGELSSILTTTGSGDVNPSSDFRVTINPNEYGLNDFEIIKTTPQANTTVINRSAYETGWVQVADTEIIWGGATVTVRYIAHQTYIVNSGSSAQTFIGGAAAGSGLSVPSSPPSGSVIGPIRSIAGASTGTSEDSGGGWIKATRVYGAIV